MKFRYWKDALAGTIFVFSLIIFAGSLLKVFDILDPIGDALKDIEITDIVFSEIREIPPVDTNIVIVNFGNLPRDGIAELINIINKDRPRAIGIDAFFRNERDSASDIILSNALNSTENLVLVSKLADYNEQKKQFREIIYSHPKFIRHAKHAFANLTSTANDQDQFKICRSFPPVEEVNGEEHLAFGVYLAQYIDSAAVERFLRRHQKLETINYRGNVMDFGRSNFGTRYFALDWMDVFQQQFEPGTFRNKIVLLGFLGETFNDPSWDDKFYTPLNKNYAGKTNPDMFGVVIHANIISMILKGDYLSEMSGGAGLTVGIVLCFLNLLLFTLIHYKLPKWYDGLTKLIQVSEVSLLFFIIIMVFYFFNYKLNLTISIIAILLSGDAQEVYFGVFKNLISLLYKRFKLMIS